MLTFSSGAMGNSGPVKGRYILYTYKTIPSESFIMAGIIIIYGQVAAATFLKIDLKLEHFQAIFT